jgi:hypothetical protein
MLRLIGRTDHDLPDDFAVQIDGKVLFEACRASELSVRVSPTYFPLSFPSLAGSPVFTMEDSNKML